MSPRVRRVFVLSCSLGLCAGFAPVLSSWLLWCALRCWWCLFLFPFSPCCFCVPPSPLPILYTTLFLHTSCSGAGILVSSHPSSLPPHSHLSPHPLPPRPLTDPLPPSLAGTLCRTVWRRSIRQSNPESLPSGHSGDRWVTRGEGLRVRRPHHSSGLTHHPVFLPLQDWIRPLTFSVHRYYCSQWLFCLS